MIIAGGCSNANPDEKFADPLGPGREHSNQASVAADIDVEQPVDTGTWQYLVTKPVRSDFSYDHGVTATEIRVGYNTDLSGILDTWPTSYMAATKAYWGWVNDNGGIGGRQVRAVELDSRFDGPTHLENYLTLASQGPESVVIIGQSTGWDQNVAISDRLVGDSLLAIPASWNHDWIDPVVGQNILEVQTDYCLEAINGVTFMSQHHGPRMALITLPGDYGQSAAVGARLAAKQLGLELVYDGAGSVDYGQDVGPVVEAVGQSSPDFVWVAVHHTTLAQLVAAAVDHDIDTSWGGNSPSFSPDLLNTDGPGIELYDESYTHFSPTAMWGTIDSGGMATMMDELGSRIPNERATDVHIAAWTHATAVHQILIQAATDGDMTRSGVVAAANKVDVMFGGLAMDRNWRGEAGDYVARGSYAFDVDASVYSHHRNVSDPGSNNGFVIIDGPFVSDVAARVDYPNQCEASNE